MKKWHKWFLLYLILGLVYVVSFQIATPPDPSTWEFWREMFIIFAVIHFVSPLYPEPFMSIWFEQERLKLPERKEPEPEVWTELELEEEPEPEREKQKADPA